MTDDKYGLAMEVASADDLDLIVRAVKRERAIREGMAQTGEGREVVAEFLDANESMDREAVLELADGKPTTMVAALTAYVADVESRHGDYVSTYTLAGELNAILEYPWSAEEALVQLHQAWNATELHISHPDDEHLEVAVGSNHAFLFGASHDGVGWAGMEALESAAKIVHRAVLARVIPDRPHHAQLSAADTERMIHWLTSVPRGGSIWLGDRVSLDAVGNGGILVRTRPFNAHNGK